MLFLSHLPLIWYQIPSKPICFLCTLLSALIATLLHILPGFLSVGKRRYSFSPTLRLRILIGGHRILRLCFFGILFQMVFYLVCFILGRLSPQSGEISFFGVVEASFTAAVWAADLLYVSCYFYLLLLNGCTRILCTCRRLGIGKRLGLFVLLWIPVINLFVWKYLSRRAYDEYDMERCRFENRAARSGKEVCATKYPLILLHGIGFRDLRYFNYWGRIPKALVQNGAVVYYGHQQAWGTIEDNAEIIRDKVNEILKENNCEKVNIIAHSKGGLDARYLISGLHMEQQVASLTTISTPHRGSELLNLLNKLPDGIYHFIASRFDAVYRKFGDTHPDCYHSSKQLSPAFCDEFNKKYPNAPSVYYQSYTSFVKHTLGDTLLSIPNLAMFLAGASKNDGLVTVESAKWGNFREAFVSSGWRGISHGDMIDLKREDYRGFDVIETYIRIVSDLKQRGY